ncbi:DUF2254 domain-containing protein [Pseudomonas sp. NCCP-436]|uniref:DUF2254 domain-containing protein n=1 Tax=Pseudomonas sp. NCCP-436 TaxID=2842481 RepID=UPI001C80134A|nr:DUF2254 domain-containing protein [Pseudomonas sp. NCCP-436]GIZ13696.1 hypothetical protein NCCP436_31120 [Pseudomonas sp. NCCP-436]
MTARWQWLTARFFRLMWVRATLYSLAGVLTALLALLIKPYVPDNVALSIGAEAVDKILAIIASSMLAVTTFSLSTMLSAYNSASSGATPRATQLLIQDPATQNMLATFIGSFLFSVVSIIALSTGVYGESGRVVLFIVTLLVIALIVITLLRWIDYLTRFGRLGETTDRVEQATTAALKVRRTQPYLGGQPLTKEMPIPASAVKLKSPITGYVQHIDMQALGRLCSEAHQRIYLLSTPGTFIDTSTTLACCEGIDEERLPELLAAFALGYQRTFEQDPRFGLQVLTEIASRGLSSAINDLGTPIEIIGRGVRLFSRYAAYQPDTPTPIPGCERVFAQPLAVADLFDDFFRPIARDGASLVEVHIRLQKALASLAQIDPPLYAEQAQRHSELAMAYAEQSNLVEQEKVLLRELANQVRVLTLGDSQNDFFATAR